jgi:hypothetical protein
MPDCGLAQINTESCERTNGQQIAGQSQWQILGLPRKGDEQRKRRREQRISIGDRIGGGTSGNGPTGARLIDRHDLLTQNSAEPIHRYAERHVDGATRGGIGK